jgi:hypothetical protein
VVNKQHRITADDGRSLLALCILVAAIFFTMIWISPPAPLSVDAPATDFSAGRAMLDLEMIAREPHPIGASLEHAGVRDYLLSEIRSLGLEPQLQDTFGLHVISPGYILGGAVENVLVRIPGTDPEGAILLMSHYDSSPGVPGAVDSGSGVVTILELLRALRAGAPLRQDVIILFTDGEEPGTIGAQTFVAQHPWFADVSFVINMDQFWVGPPVFVRFSRGNGMLIQALARSTSSTKPAHLSFPFDIFPSGDTDLSPFILAGIPGAEINGGGPFTEKHTALDRPDLVDPGSLQQVGDQMLALVRYLGNQSTLEVDTPEQTFFPVMGLLVHYPSNLAWLFAIAAGVCFLGTIVYGFYKRQLTWRGLGLGFPAFLLGLVLSVVIANLVWRGILALHPGYAFTSASMFRQKLSDDFLYAIGFIVLALAVTSSSIAMARRKGSALDMAASVLVIWFPLTIVSTILVPATSYLFTWVLLSGSLALLLALAVRFRKNARAFSGLGFLVSAVLATILWIPLFYIAILAGPMSPDTPLLSMMVGLVVLWSGGIMPILDWITTPKHWLLPAAALLVALGFLVSGNFLVGKNSPPPLVNPIGYWLDANKGEAHWVSFSEKLDERQSNLLAAPVRQVYTELFPQAPRYSVLTSDAPVLDLDGPRLDVLSDEWMTNNRILKAVVIPSIHDCISIIIPEEPRLLAITVPYKGRTELSTIDTGGWWLRFYGIPVDGIEITFEFLGRGPIQLLLVEEQTGLPSFPGLSTQPEPGTMKSPGDIFQSIPTDFTAIYRTFSISSVK